MNQSPGFWARHLVRIAALALLLAIYGFARQPTLSPEERHALASRFAFERLALPRLPGAPLHSIRQVHPSLKPLDAWISSVGAGVGVGDFDGNGLADDACWVDPRVDKVLVAPLPGTGSRYPLFTLDPGPLPYDPQVMAPMGCLPGDFNEDGLIDFVVYYWGRSPIVFLRRGGNLAGAAPRADLYKPVELVAGPLRRWYTNSLTSADVDGDGHLDLILGNYFQDNSRILEAAATGTEEMQHSMSHAPNGGSKHLLLFQRATAGEDPTVEFADHPEVFDPQTAYSWTLAIGAADLDGDLLPEIYFANDFGNDRLLHNLSTPGHPRFAVLSGRRGFTTPSSKVLGHDSFKGMGVDFGDINGDGLLDIYVSNIAQNYALEENHFVWVNTGEARKMREGVAPFVDRSEQLGLARSFWGWDARLADFDNDGVLEAIQATGFVKGDTDRWPELQELAMGNDNLLQVPAMWPYFNAGADLSGQVHDPFFVRSASGRYFDIAPELGMGDAQISRGISIADIDGDGRLDFVVANQWGDSYLFHNRSPHPGNFLGLDLRLPVAGPITGSSAGPTSGQTGAAAANTAGAAPRVFGRPAIGASVTVFLPDGRRLVGQVDGGSGHSGKRAPTLHFGLGRLPAGTPLRTEIRWRDATGQVHARTWQLVPGWHRLLLDETAGGQPDQLRQTGQKWQRAANSTPGGTPRRAAPRVAPAAAGKAASR